MSRIEFASVSYDGARPSRSSSRTRVRCGAGGEGISRSAEGSPAAGASPGGTSKSFAGARRIVPRTRQLASGSGSPTRACRASSWRALVLRSRVPSCGGFSQFRATPPRGRRLQSSRASAESWMGAHHATAPRPAPQRTASALPWSTTRGSRAGVRRTDPGSSPPCGSTPRIASDAGHGRTSSNGWVDRTRRRLTVGRSARPRPPLARARVWSACICDGCWGKAREQSPATCCRRHTSERKDASSFPRACPACPPRRARGTGCRCAKLRAGSPTRSTKPPVLAVVAHPRAVHGHAERPSIRGRSAARAAGGALGA